VTTVTIILQFDVVSLFGRFYALNSLYPTVVTGAKWLQLIVVFGFDKYLLTVPAAWRHSVRG